MYLKQVQAQLDQIEPVTDVPHHGWMQGREAFQSSPPGDEGQKAIAKSPMKQNYN